MADHAPQGRAWRTRVRPPSAVRSQPLDDAPAPSSRWDIREAPIHAADIAPAGILLRWVVGIAFVAYSIITTTIIIGGWIYAATTAGVDLGLFTLPYAYIIGATVGVLVTVGEWTTVEKAPPVHWFLIVALDAPFSAWQTFVWLMILVEANAGADPSTAVLLLVGAASIAWGIVTAKLGEKLLLKR